MTNFRISSLVAASVLLAACGSGGGGNTSSVEPLVPPSRQTPVSVDTVILSNIDVVSLLLNRVIRVNCSGLVCRDDTGDSVNLSYALPDEQFLERNGRVNGPTTRTGSEDGSDFTLYAYWMGDSMFSVAETLGFNSALGNFDSQFAMVAGDNTDSRPLGDATYTGKTVAISTGDGFEGYQRGDVEYGDFYLTYDFGDRTVEVDIEFDDWDASFLPSRVSSNGSFSRATTDGGNLRGAFFGSGHKEVAGTYNLPSYEVVGAFGGIKD